MKKLWTWKIAAFTGVSFGMSPFQFRLLARGMWISARRISPPPAMRRRIARCSFMVG